MKINKKIAILTLISVILSNISFAKNIEKKQIVKNLLNSIETNDASAASHINEKKYIQHNLAVEDGIAGFGKILSQLPKNSAKVNVVRVFEDGEFVFTHTDYNFFGPKVGFDIFRFENGKIVEHWDNLAEKSKTPNPSGRSQIDGSSEILDLDKSKQNKKLVTNFVKNVLIKQQYNKMTDYISSENYIQHNAQIGDNLSGLRSGLEALAKNNITLTYSKIHKVLGEGNFVLVVSEGKFGKKLSAYYDLFRVADNKIVEHWDVIEEIPEKSQWKNSNGKF